MDGQKTSSYFDSDADCKQSGSIQAKEPNFQTEIIEEPIDVLISTEYKSTVVNQCSSQVKERNSNSDDDDWEELEDTPGTSCSPLASQIIVSFNPKKLLIEQECEKKMQREISLMWKRMQKTQASQLLQAYSLCFLAHGLHISAACDDPLFQSLALSVLPLKLGITSYIQRLPTKRRKVTQALDTINDVLNWYRTNSAMISPGSAVAESCRLNFGLVVIFRSLSIRCRILIHFWPGSMKVENLATIKYNGKDVIQIEESSKSAEQESNKDSRNTVSTRPKDKKKGGAKSIQTQSSAYFQNDPDTDTSSQIFPFGVLHESTDHVHCCWLEVHDSDFQKWLVVDPVSLSISTAEQLKTRLCSPLSYSLKKINVDLAYVVAFGEKDVALDVTARYASSTLHTATRKARGNAEQENWWKETIALLKPSGKFADAEEAELAHLASAEKNPVPSTIAALTSHPLYVLGRHIHKFEAIYPPDTKPISHVRGEPVFTRSCVHGLHTREKWLLEGRQVCKNEEPYKTVTGHRKSSKKDRNDREPPKMVGLFGQWQTEEYVPPTIVDGKLPRNVYGNIEVFKPWMLPKGCCHLTQQGIQGTAKRLGIDFVPAMVGWDFHAGVNHPVIDGIVVLEDVADVLECALRQEKQIAVEEDMTNKSKRAVSNWRRFVKAILLKERLKDQYLSYM